MKEIRKTSQFKKDYKRFKNDKEFVETLMGIVKLLAEGNQIPEEYNPHSLKGNWKNYMECHIENEVLLKFWYIYVSKFEETFICKREIDALPPIIRFAVFILLTEPSRIPLFNLLAIELLMAE